MAKQTCGSIEFVIEVSYPKRNAIVLEGCVRSAAQTDLRFRDIPRITREEIERIVNRVELEEKL